VESLNRDIKEYNTGLVGRNFDSTVVIPTVVNFTKGNATSFKGTVAMLDLPSFQSDHVKCFCQHNVLRKGKKVGGIFCCVTATRNTSCLGQAQRNQRRLSVCEILHVSLKYTRVHENKTYTYR
jgi:hypothetical protein